MSGSAGAACNVCLNGINYTIACDCFPCGGNGLSMSVSNPNPSISQTPRSGNTACCVSNSLNAIGKWGTALTGIGMSSTALIVILLVVGFVLFFAMRK